MNEKVKKNPKISPEDVIGGLKQNLISGLWFCLQ